MRILVSACLIGLRCRYDANDKADERVLGLIGDNELIPVCPEQLGGLQTPRMPAERLGERVINKDGSDVTNEFKEGARQTVRLCKLLGCECAVLKSKSPSCGAGVIYDGTFTSKLTQGNGVTAQELIDAGIEVYDENCIEEIKRRAQR